MPGEHAAAGDFDAAMKLLNRQLGVINFAPLKQHFIDAAFATHASTNSSSIPGLTWTWTCAMCIDSSDGGGGEDAFSGPFYTSERRGGVQRRQLKLKGVEDGD